MVGQVQQKAAAPKWVIAALAEHSNASLREAEADKITKEVAAANKQTNVLASALSSSIFLALAFAVAAAISAKFNSNARPQHDHTVEKLMNFSELACLDH